MRVVRELFLWVVAVGVLTACQPGSRVEAREESDPSPAQHVVFGADSMRWVTYSRQPMRDREAGVNQMLGHDAGRFWSRAATHTTLIDDWPMIRLLCAKAIATKEVRALPWLVRSWAMPSVTVQDDDRPERESIARITGQPSEHTLDAIVFEPAETISLKTQVAAWSVLCRVWPESVIRQRLGACDPETANVFAALLIGVVPSLDVLPSDRCAVARLVRLHAELPGDRWCAVARWRQAYGGAGPANLALRHVPALTRRNTQRDGWTRQQWLGHVAKRLDGRSHAARGAGGGEGTVVVSRPELFGDYVEEIGIADMIVIDMLLDAMGSPGFVAAAFTQAETDRLDTRTEWGGAITWADDGGLVLREFLPVIRRHDQAYIASSSCLDAVFTGLAHFHFHAQQHDNASWAGPGKGDLDFANRYHATAVVLTFLDAETLNVDAYFPGGVVVDLGCITR